MISIIIWFLSLEKDEIISNVEIIKNVEIQVMIVDHAGRCSEYIIVVEGKFSRVCIFFFFRVFISLQFLSCDFKKLDLCNVFFLL